jgi:hypothetical protein
MQPDDPGTAWRVKRRESHAARLDDVKPTRAARILWWALAAFLCCFIGLALAASGWVN